MNWTFIDTMQEQKVRDLIAYLNDNLHRVKKHKWCVEMKGVWKEGRDKAKQRLTELSN